ncbi:MAG: glycine zipper domain-containing protein [Candidatus Omnitrophota bacterium]
MKFISLLLAILMTISVTDLSFARSSSDDPDSGSSALGSAVMGGLLGAGLGAAIGSGSGKAGQGAAIGAGVGALGGTLVGAEKARKEKQMREAEEREAEAYEQDNSYLEPEPAAAPKDVNIKKRIVREYDEDGNIISEKEVAN